MIPHRLRLRSWARSDRKERALTRRPSWERRTRQVPTETNQLWDKQEIPQEPRQQRRAHTRQREGADSRRKKSHVVNFRRDSDPAVTTKQDQTQNLQTNQENSGSKNRRKMRKLHQKSVQEIDAWARREHLWRWKTQGEDGCRGRPDLSRR
jgi:hypothetical protein